jgi:hypothetical protein
MNKEIECHVCHRLEFGDRVTCEVCGWPVRDVKLGEPVFGFDVAIEIRLPGLCNTKVIEKHFATPSVTVAKNRAKRTTNFVQVLALRPISETNYIRAYGVPGQRM